MKHAPQFYDEEFKRRALEMVAAGRGAGDGGRGMRDEGRGGRRRGKWYIYTSILTLNDA
ncbi:MAG: hypothetical protein OKBPIBMD_00324 [Chlorobi bacterium]|nr:hypothetical protein [Chlorobiota bacterium]